MLPDSPWFVNYTIASARLARTITDPVVAEDMSKTYEHVIPADAFARMVSFAISQRAGVDVNEILFRPTSQVA